MKTRIDRYLSVGLTCLLMVMTTDVLWGVFTRYVLGAQAPWTEELARFLLIWIGLLGAAYASGQGLHLSIDLLPERLSGNRRRQLELLIRFFVLLFAVSVMVVGGCRLLYLTWALGQTSPALRLPMWMVYSVLPLSGGLVTAYAWQDIRQFRRPAA
jgi:TRAP-type C4-dicarboxylate transport system permease small subunit